MKNKKGLNIDKDVLIAMILGLLVVGISLYFIFHEYFSSDEINLQACRQSVILRSNSPQIVDGVVGINWLDIKSKFPLKCKTDVVDIDFEDTAKAEKIVGEALAQCWYLFLEGTRPIFPGEGGEAMSSYCVPCSRIHFDEKVIDYYSKQENLINVSRALKMPLRNSGITVETYLKNSFGYSVSNIDVFGWEGFGGEESTKYRITGDKFIVYEFDGDFFTALNLGADIGNLDLPMYLSSKNGDILIFFQQLNFAKLKTTSSSLIYFQANQKEPDPFREINQVPFLEREGYDTGVCKTFDGVPL